MARHFKGEQPIGEVVRASEGKGKTVTEQWAQRSVGLCDGGREASVQAGVPSQ